MGKDKQIIDIFTSYLFFVKIVFFLAAVLILFSNIDDLFVDIYYLFHRIKRRVLFYKKIQDFDSGSILIKKEQYFSLMVPAWQESSVIFPMLKNTLSSYKYKKFHIFVGCYPNDPDTISEVGRLIPHFPNLHINLLKNPGPTSKADCLNQIYADIQLFETENTIEFAGYILHDAEDIVHPLELKLYNYLIPQKDMIQIPVIPLERPWYNLTGGHYQDEFAENHIKELVVRENLTGQVPSAGVGTVLSRRAMTMISENHTADPFDTGNLTEDYDLGLRLKEENLKLIFARFLAGPNDIIATREFFPDKINAVIRQKSRWLMGIAFQGWRNRGWQGSLTLRYALFRDRKGIITAQLAMLAYFIMFNILLVWAIEWMLPDGYRYPPLVRRGELLEYILWANLALLLNRAMHRMYFTYQIYGVLSAFLSLPRQLWGNILNFLASLRAIYFYSKHLLFGTALAWDKTDHIFPDMGDLVPYRRKLGELLIHSNAITIASLQTALSTQKNVGGKLGKILIDQGHITEQQLEDALDLQVSEDEHQD